MEFGSGDFKVHAHDTRMFTTLRFPKSANNLFYARLYVVCLYIPPAEKFLLPNLATALVAVDLLSAECMQDFLLCSMYGETLCCVSIEDGAV